MRRIRLPIWVWITVGVLVGFLIDVAIAGLLQVSIHRSNAATRHAAAAQASAAEAAAQASAARVAAYQSCLVANRIKAADLRRWNALLSLAATGPQTPAMIAFRAKVETINLTTDRPDKCTP